MTFEIVDPGFPVWAWLIPLILTVVVFPLLCWLDWALDLNGSLGGPAFAFLGVGGWAILCGIIGGGGYAEEVKSLKVAELEALGFEDVTLEVDKFTASQNGDYFSGALIEIDTDTYQVAEVVK